MDRDVLELHCTHNICFRGEIRKILSGYPLLSVVMIKHYIPHNYRTVHLSFSKVLGKLVVKYVPTYTKGALKKKKKKKKKRSVKDLHVSCDVFVLFFFCVCFFLILFYKSICCGYSFELHQQVDAIQMCTHNICLYKHDKEVDKKYNGCNPRTTELLDCVLIGVCVVFKSNMVA